MDPNAVMEQFPAESRTEAFKAAISGLNVTDMASLAEGVVKAFGALGQVETMTGEATELKSKLEGAVFVPGENASAEAVGAFNRSIGVPGTISEYGLSEMEAEEGGKAVLDAMLKAGVRKQVAGALVNELNAVDTSVRQAAEQQRTEKRQKVLEELGEGAEGMVSRGLEVLFPGEENSELREAAAKNPDFVKAWHSVGRVSTENPRQFQNAARGAAVKSPYPSMDSRGIK